MQNYVKGILGADGPDSKLDGDALASPSRRRLLVTSALGAVALTLGRTGTLTAAPRTSAAGAKEIRIGFIDPRSGPLGTFGRSDPYTLSVVRRALANGVAINGVTYRVSILDFDSQSNPARASQLATQLINRHQVHLMLTTSTPETVNPVSDACEASGVPCIATDCPLESFFFGRGGQIGKPSPFKWSFDMSFGVKQFADGYIGQWPKIKTNRRVAVMYPNDADGNGFRQNLIPILEKNGYKVVDPGAYTDGMTDFSSQIALFRREGCEIFSEVGLPPDIDAFWRQAAQLHLLQNIKIAQMTKSGFFMSEIEPLGELGYGISALTAWSPVFPYKSPLTGATSRALADGYQKATGRHWDNQQGQLMSLFEVAVQALKGAKDPLDRAAIRDVIPKIDMVTTVGRVNFGTGPYPNTAATNLLGAQYVRAPKGAKFPMERVIVDNTEDRDVPIERAPVPYRV